jgi:hypothetical protein
VNDYDRKTLKIGVAAMFTSVIAIVLSILAVVMD